MKATIDQLVVVDLPQFRDARGLLVPVEFSRIVPFEVRRMFWIVDVPAGGKRGGHAHMRCHQFAICMAGQVAIDAFDGQAKGCFELSTAQALYIKPGIFTTERFIVPGSILSVMCDRPYEADDYLYELK
jgi:dTDP-4-dehydrorhamnose 3,5-epimerase-like enzyme